MKVKRRNKSDAQGRHVQKESDSAGDDGSDCAGTATHMPVQGISFLGPAACLAGCSLLVPSGVKHSAGVLSGQGTAIIVALLSLSFALGAWARGGLYCNHQVPSSNFAHGHFGNLICLGSSSFLSMIVLCLLCRGLFSKGYLSDRGRNTGTVRVPDTFEGHLQDLSPKYAGALLGISNTAGAIPGVLGITSVGFLLDRTGSWGPSLFYPIIACYLFGLVVYTVFASSKRTDWE